MHMYTHTLQYYSDMKKSKSLSFETTWIDLEGIMLSEISQRKTSTISFHLGGKSKTKEMNKQNKSTHRYRKTDDCQRVG